MSGLVDPSPPGGSIVPYRNFTPPPETPDKLAVSVTPGSQDQYAIGSGEQIAAVPTVGKPPAAAPNAGGPANPIKDVVRDEWLAAGYPPAAVEGIMKRINAESGWDVHNTGDKDPNTGNPTSFGLYQHHADRAQKLAQYLENNKVDLKDPVALARAQTKFAISEMNGGDSIAAKHKGELQNPNITPQEAYGTFTSSFERPAGSPGNEETNLRSNALGPFNAGASAYLQTWQQDIQKRGKEYDDALAEGKDLRKAARAAMEKWELNSEHPPQDMRENWNQWAGAAIGLAMLGGFFGKNHTAAINAAGEMLQAANAADVRAYDISYKKWKDHNDSGLKLIELLHGEARDIVEDARKSYDQKVTELGTLSTAYQLQQHLDPKSVENIEKNLRVQQLTTQIAEAQKKDADEQKIRIAKTEAITAQEKQELDQHPEWKGVVPAWRHLEIVNEAEKLGKGQLYKPGADETISVVGADGKVVKEGGAYRLPDGSGYRWSGTNEPVDVPPGGKLNLLPKGSGRQAAQTVQAITGAASELTKDLQNAMKLPIASRMSVFMGVENQTPSTLTEALQHTLTRETVTEDDSIKMGIVFQGIQRELGILENQGRATGIVGLSDSNKMLMPQKGWSSSDVLLSYAQMRQIGEQDLEAYMKSPNTSDEQRNYMQELRNRLATAVPFTVQDVLGLDPTKKQSVAEFADKVLATKKGEELPAGISPGSKKIGTYQGKDVYQAPDGSKWQP